MLRASRTRYAKTRVTWALAALVVAALLEVAHAGDAVAAALAQGDRQWAEGRLDAAQKTFEQAVADDPGSLDAWMKLGGFRLARNQFADGIRAYQKALGLDARNVRAWLGLGVAYLHTDRKGAARGAFEEALRLDPGRREQLAPVMEALEKAPSR